MYVVVTKPHHKHDVPKVITTGQNILQSRQQM